MLVDLAEIAGYITNRTVMVTGAGGTIGSELCRQVARFNPRCLVLLGLDETSIFDIEQEMRASYPEMRVAPVVADLRDLGRIQHVMEQNRPEVIFHAAAHKHVPLMEIQPPEAIRNNVEGLWGFLDMAQKMHVERFVFISTDKAVNPTSVYGTTKRIGEILGAIYAQNTHMRFVTVRFGNVLGSRGSVLPTFQRQIAQGGPLTVTHPDMVRYFMTVAEACQLVVQAGAMGKGGETFVLDMGEPIKIMDLATNLIRLSGLTPGVDVDIVFTGLRPGEKLYEEPLTPEDQTKATKNSRIFIHTGDVPNARRLLPLLEELVEAGRRADEPRIRRLLKEIVPEYQPQNSNVAALPGMGLSTTGGEARAH
ncbi:UDP-N-acetylglucosamine 4,6-dehydratase family protein [Sulfobacillus thermotolerans]|uniref:UDP-N-acetylglucosamine 4,6-dehydratase family protein n=1 Tax=Sulfobacillus thermotolerans TaxID=338644 RepID=UPI0033690890